MGLNNCPKLVSIDGLERATQLMDISLHDMAGFEGFAGLGKVKALDAVSISKCPKLNSVDWLPPSVRELTVIQCPNLQSLDHLRSLKKLYYLWVDEEAEGPVPKEEVDQLVNDLIDQLSVFYGPEDLKAKFVEARKLRKKRKKQIPKSNPTADVGSR